MDTVSASTSGPRDGILEDRHDGSADDTGNGDRDKPGHEDVAKEPPVNSLFGPKPADGHDRAHLGESGAGTRHKGSSAEVEMHGFTDMGTQTANQVLIGRGGNIKASPQACMDWGEAHRERTPPSPSELQGLNETISCFNSKSL